jgi:RimJ/RimL family protein N-acetyltransferase
MESFSLRQFEESDWQNYRSIRLEALKTHPTFFSPSVDEFKLQESDWRNRLINKNNGIFGLYLDAELIGLTGIVRDRVEVDKAHLVMSYVREKYRNKGLSRVLYETRIAWARNQGNIKKLVLDHNENNIPSRRAHQKFGFKLVKEYEEVSPTGELRKVLTWELYI